MDIGILLVILGKVRTGGCPFPLKNSACIKKKEKTKNCALIRTVFSFP